VGVDGVGAGTLAVTEVGAVTPDFVKALPIATTPVVATTVNAMVTIQDCRPLGILFITLLSAVLTSSLR